MNGLIDKIFEHLLSSGIDMRVVVIMVALLPIAEARLAIPMAIKCGLSPFSAFLCGFIGSSLAVPVLLLVLIPLIKKLACSKLFKKIGEGALERFNDKAQSIVGSDAKKLLGTAAFVAIPLPLTGVWTGSAVASILALPYLKSLIAVTLGNLVASIIVVIITVALNEYINLIMAAFTLIAFLAACLMLVKALTPKKKSAVTKDD
ncbi:MAG: hypothetical protein E7350_03980 [Clostridiales bacterium]|nr:hypothetical protein [Clostridiales bacterium]